MSVTLAVKHATFSGDEVDSELQSVAIEYKNDVTGNRGVAYITRDGTHRLKGEESSEFLAQLATHRVEYLEKAKDEFSWPTVKKTVKSFDKDGYTTSITEYY